MTRKEALAELIEKVEAGLWWNDSGIAKSFCAKSGLGSQSLNIGWAFKGSLGSAKALHEAVLTGWGYFGGLYVAGDGSLYTVFSPDRSTCECGWSLFPARAWLLAILRALHAQETD